MSNDMASYEVVCHVNLREGLEGVNRWSVLRVGVAFEGE